MLSFDLRAKTLSGDSVVFSLKDYPTKISEDTFVLLGKPGSPILKYSNIRRGFANIGLFEGDLVSYNGQTWCICYERGFYAINALLEKKSILDVGNTVIGDYFNTDFPVTINLRSRHLYKYQDTIFRLEDIVGVYNNKLIIRALSEPVDPEYIQQEICKRVGTDKVYIGDTYDGHTYTIDDCILFRGE